jgi:hypothetical protein
MDNIIDLIATNAKPSEVSDAVKSVLYAKAAERIDAARPLVAASMFGGEEYADDTQETPEDQE